MLLRRLAGGRSGMFLLLFLLRKRWDGESRNQQRRGQNAKPVHKSCSFEHKWQNSEPQLFGCGDCGGAGDDQ
jgi:hypothetical protein